MNVAFTCVVVTRAADAGVLGVGVVAGVVSTINEPATDHAEAFPAASSARARQKYVPSTRWLGVQLQFVLFAIPLGAVALCSTLVQELVEHSCNDTVPVSPASGSEKPAESVGVTFVRAATAPSVGVAGAVVSSVKLPLEIVVADVLPATSCAVASHQYVPSGRLAGVQFPEALFASGPTDGEVPAIEVHELSLHTWNVSVPLSADPSGSENCAERFGIALSREPTLPSAGAVGAVVSSTKLRVALHEADWLPAASCAWARQ